jgi:protein-S-isoprenylcysteine O-methyltransferase Ste14
MYLGKNSLIDHKKYIGSIIMLSFGVISFFRWNSSGELFFLLLSLRDVIASYFLAKREESQANGNIIISIIAYLSSGLPLFYLSAPYGVQTKMISLSADLFSIVGFLIVTMATIDLGTKLGVSPAKRGNKCVKGLYRFLKHPMYFGYGIAQIGWILLNNANIMIYIVSLALFFIRARAENKILNNIT